MKNPLKKKLRIRFVLFSMLSLFLLQSAIVGISIYNNYRDLVTKSDMLISQLHNKPSGSSRYFSVRIPTGKDTVYPDVVQHVSVTAEQAATFAQKAVATGRDRGFLEGYRYHIYRNESGTRIYFLSRESGIEMCISAARNMIWVSVLGLLGVCLLLILVSGWVVKPLVDNHNRQKAFITAAGHELKTPLTVISTNAQMQQMESGDSRWLQGIQQQVIHLTKMTNDLVTLSKAEEYDNPLLREAFSFSDTLEEMVQTYEVIAKQKDIRLEATVTPALIYSGSRAEVQQLVQILLDNACKYCPPEGVIRVSAKKSFHGVSLSVVNTAQPLQEDLQTLRQRFSRGQNAAGTTGFGLGLSIAEAIARRHKGNITVSADAEGNFCVEVVLS